MHIICVLFMLLLIFAGINCEWCNYNHGSMFCKTGCCGSYWNRFCCPATKQIQANSVAHRHGNKRNTGEWCSDNGGSRFCSTGCCGTSWNRTCCPGTTLAPYYNTTYHRNLTSSHSNNTGEWCNENGGSRFCRTGCCGSYWNRYCCPVTDHPTTPPIRWNTTVHPTWWPTTASYNGVWCNLPWGRTYCRYGCCGFYNYTYCCSSTENPPTVKPQVAVKTGTIVTIVVSCLAAIIGTTAIIIGIYCCLKTQQEARQQTLIPTTVVPPTQPLAPRTGVPTYMTPATSAGSSGPQSYSNQTYFMPVSQAQIPSQPYIQGQHTQTTTTA